MRLKKHRKWQEQGTKKDLVTLQAKKDKATVDLSLNSEDEQDDFEASLLVKVFKTLFKSNASKK